MSLLFVYGTLKRGGSNHHLMAGQKFLGDARTTPGFRLYRLDGHPGMIPKSDDHDGVTGEVWSVDATCLAQLDVFEGLPEGFYRREAIKLLSPFAEKTVETYLYAQNVAGRIDIGSTWNIPSGKPLGLKFAVAAIGSVIIFLAAVGLGLSARHYQITGQPMPNGHGRYMSFRDGYFIAMVVLLISIAWFLSARRLWLNREK